MEFIAGFFDGDGCVRLEPPTEKRPHPNPRLLFSQAHDAGPPPELLYIQSVVGGSINIKRNGTATLRTAWELHVDSQQEVRAAAAALKNLAIVKAPQLQRIHKYLLEGKAGAMEAAQDVSAKKELYHSVEIERGRLTTAYIAGLFASDGSVFMSRYRDHAVVRSNITQWSCHRLLVCIEERLGFGNTKQRGQLSFAASQTKALLELIQPHMQCSQKMPQINVVLGFLRERTSVRGKKRTESEIEHTLETAKKLKEMKKM